MTSTLAIAATLTLARTALAADTHEVTKTDARSAVGQPGTASVTITGKNGWHLNAEAPISIKLAAGPGVAVDKPKLVRADLAESTETRARFDVKFTASEPGKKTIDGEARFVMCQATACQPVTEKVTLAVDVAAPDAKAAPRKSKK